MASRPRRCCGRALQSRQEVPPGEKSNAVGAAAKFNELAATIGAHLPTERLGGVGHGRPAGRIPMQGALFANSS